MVLDLIPPRGWVPDFITPSGPGTPQELLERVRATTRAKAGADLQRVAEHRSLPSWTRRLADDPEALRLVADSLQHVYDCLLDPHWRRITAVTTADSASRARHVLRDGMEGVLARVNPRRVRWNPPVLEVLMASGTNGDLHLEGRGLLLVSSVFGVDAPVIDPDAEPQPFLTYPVGAAHGSSGALFPGTVLSPHSPAARSLASLLGPTRAAVLTAVANHPGCSTKELAAAVGIAPASASEHATTLRAAGLLHTVRHGTAAAHSTTDAAQILLQASGA
ncbi:DUF5937 family protein [Streptomyces sp. NPDC007971]|uniref:ArsR/SmtB family transcription factor n=1 Tax=Streptomyces sp. NPDC007971 TaxID=3364799 RepID=UPI0036E75928